MSPDPRIRTNPDTIRAALTHAQTHTLNDTASRYGVSKKAVIRWRQLRAQNPDWPTAADDTAWQERTRVDNQCSRREGSRYSACRCAGCIAHRSRTRKLHRAGLTPTNRSEQAWRVIHGWLAQGWTTRAIAEVTGLRYQSLYQTLSRHRRTGRQHRWSHRSAEAIIATHQRQPTTAGYVGGLGATRRLQALSALGYSVADIVAATGLPQATVSVIRSGAHTRVRPSTDATIREVYERLSMRLPTARASSVTQARAYARRRRWAPPLAYEDIDDPRETPRANVRRNYKKDAAA